MQACPQPGHLSLQEPGPACPRARPGARGPLCEHTQPRPCLRGGCSWVTGVTGLFTSRGLVKASVSCPTVPCSFMALTSVTLYYLGRILKRARECERNVGKRMDAGK